MGAVTIRLSERLSPLKAPRVQTAQKRRRKKKKNLGMFQTVCEWANMSLNRCASEMICTVCLAVCLEYGLLRSLNVCDHGFV